MLYSGIVLFSSAAAAVVLRTDTRPDAAGGPFRGVDV